MADVRSQMSEDRNWNSEGGMGKSEESNLNSESNDQ